MNFSTFRKLGYPEKSVCVCLGVDRKREREYNNAFINKSVCVCVCVCVCIGYMNQGKAMSWEYKM